MVEKELFGTFLFFGYGMDLSSILSKKESFIIVEYSTVICIFAV